MKQKFAVLMLLALLLGLAGCAGGEDNQEQKLYNEACSFSENGDYEAAVAAFQELGDYMDAPERLIQAKRDRTKVTYRDVTNALFLKSWYFNGGGSYVLNEIYFMDEAVTVSQVYIDEQGWHDNGENELPFYVDSENIIIPRVDGKELLIPYRFDGHKVTFTDGNYFTDQEVLERIQGYWNLREEEEIDGRGVEAEFNFRFLNNSVQMEWAMAVDGYEGYHYEPVEIGTFSVGFGELFTDNPEIDHLYFTIYDGEIQILYYDDPLSAAFGFPGEFGYSF